MELMRCDRRETFREAVFLCTMPFWALRISCGWAALKAASAAALSPAAIASSTLRTLERMAVRRDLLTSVRRAIWRTAFLAERVFAMSLVFLEI